jgi:hypothetical protein
MSKAKQKQCRRNGKEGAGEKKNKKQINAYIPRNSCRSSI